MYSSIMNVMQGTKMRIFKYMDLEEGEFIKIITTVYDSKNLIMFIILFEKSKNEESEEKMIKLKAIIVFMVK